MRSQPPTANRQPLIPRGYAALVGTRRPAQWGLASSRVAMMCLTPFARPPVAPPSRPYLLVYIPMLGVRSLAN